MPYSFSCGASYNFRCFKNTKEENNIYVTFRNLYIFWYEVKMAEGICSQSVTPVRRAFPQPLESLCQLAVHSVGCTSKMIFWQQEISNLTFMGPCVVNVLSMTNKMRELGLVCASANQSQLIHDSGNSKQV